MFGNRMITTAIPERVYVLCREVSSKAADEIVLRGRLEPPQLGGKTQYFGAVKTAAEQLKLINIKENTISLAVDKSVIKSMDNMRAYINMNLESVSESLFYRVTQIYFQMGDAVLGHSSVSKMCDLVGEKAESKVVEDDMRAWRFWIPFLGMGYLHEPQRNVAGIILPNTAIFLKDIIEGLKIKKNTEFTVDEFISTIKPYANIVLQSADDTLNYGVSCGLRALNDLGYIKMEHRSDAQVMKSLYRFDESGEDVVVTHITIRG